MDNLYISSVAVIENPTNQIGSNTPPSIVVGGNLFREKSNYSKISAFVAVYGLSQSTIVVQPPSESIFPSTQGNTGKDCNFF